MGTRRWAACGCLPPCLLEDGVGAWSAELVSCRGPAVPGLVQVLGSVCKAPVVCAWKFASGRSPRCALYPDLGTFCAPGHPPVWPMRACLGVVPWCPPSRRKGGSDGPSCMSLRLSRHKPLGRTSFDRCGGRQPGLQEPCSRHRSRPLLVPSWHVGDACGLSSDGGAGRTVPAGA